MTKRAQEFRLSQTETDAPNDTNTIKCVPFCERHNADAVVRMNVGPEDRWQLALVILQVLLFGRTVVQLAREEKETGEKTPLDVPVMNKKLRELGCPACYGDSTYRLACRLIRDRGLDHMALVANGKATEPEWTLQ